MTRRKDLKRLIRERQQQTGQNYVAARRHVLARAAAAPPSTEPQHAGGILVEEMVDHTDHGARLGLKCRVSITATLARRIDPVALLTRLRDVLIATEADDALHVLRAAVLRGELAPLPRRTPRARMEDARQFMARVAAGIGGVSASGTMMALPITAPPSAPQQAVLVVAHVGWRSFGGVAPSAPGLVLSAADEPTLGAAAALYSLVP